jgi:hypothetical protein
MQTFLMAAVLAAAQPKQPPHGLSAAKGVPITAANFVGMWYGPATPPAEAANWLVISLSGTQYSATVYAFCSRPAKAFCKVSEGHLTLPPGGGPAQGTYLNGVTVLKYTVFPLADGTLQFIVSTTSMNGQSVVSNEVLSKIKPKPAH